MTYYICYNLAIGILLIIIQIVLLSHPPPLEAGEREERDSLLHLPDARPRTPPRGLAGPL